MKSSKRLDYNGLAEVLGQRGVVEPPQLAIALQQSAQGVAPFPEALVANGLISDWELGRVVCDLYSLPFLPVEMYSPSPKALEGLDREFLRMNNLVPMERFGQLLTVCMPGLVPAEVLGLLSAQTNLKVVPIVGTVAGNHRWIDENLVADQPAAPLPSPKISAPTPASPPQPASDDDWSSLFDAGEAAVQLELNGLEDEAAGDELI